MTTMPLIKSVGTVNRQSTATPRNLWLCNRTTRLGGVLTNAISISEKIHWCLLPMNFQPGFNTLQHHEPQAIHQIGKFICNVAVALSFTGFRCWHMCDLWFRFNARPASWKFFDDMILHLVYFFPWDLVPLVTHKQSALGRQFALSFKRDVSDFL